MLSLYKTCSNCIKGSEVKKQLVQTVILLACWLIWRTRNKMVVGEIFGLTEIT
ncbi:hypothetical protein HanRHA438_Chr07g0303971 [Helianthus annuus]|nr:hypothetical protein HanRHA438_Chr07g0303971 [Helianthus annuus]